MYALLMKLRIEDDNKAQLIFVWFMFVDENFPVSLLIMSFYYRNIIRAFIQDNKSFYVGINEIFCCFIQK